MLRLAKFGKALLPCTCSRFAQSAVRSSYLSSTTFHGAEPTPSASALEYGKVKDVLEQNRNLLQELSSAEDRAAAADRPKGLANRYRPIRLHGKDIGKRWVKRASGNKNAPSAEDVKALIEAAKTVKFDQPINSLAKKKRPVASRKLKKAITSKAKAKPSLQTRAAIKKSPSVGRSRPSARISSVLPHSDVTKPRQSIPPRALATYPLSITSTSIEPVELTPSLPPVPVATLAHNLERVLFNPGVHWVRDPRSGVYNFTPAHEKLPRVDAFAFNRLPPYITSSYDKDLRELAKREGKKFLSSTSSTTGMLCQIYFWLSKGKEVNTSMLGREWEKETREFSLGQTLPVSVILKESDGLYAVDADKSFDAPVETNILAQLGHLLEKFLTTDLDDFSKFLTDSPNPTSDAHKRQAYHYTATEHMVMRAQLDAHNQHLPRVTFDVKTRGVIAIRQDRLNWRCESAGYLIRQARGKYESFEREYYDLIRSAFLKYQFQARIGHMDGCFVAYHNTARLFGFQYIPIEEMDVALFGSTSEGDQVFKLCIGFMEKILLEATACYSGRSVKLTFETRFNVLQVFVQPVTPAQDDEPPMTLLELRGSNYLDNKFVERVAIWDTAPQTWTVGYKLDRQTGSPAESVTKPLSAEDISQRYEATFQRQQVFDSMYLPSGISEKDVERVVAAKLGELSNAGADEAGDDSHILTLPFPLVEGIRYVSKPSKNVQRLRVLARKGAKDTERYDAEGLERKIVQLRSSVQIEETQEP